MFRLVTLKSDLVVGAIVCEWVPGIGYLWPFMILSGHLRLYIASYHLC